MWPESLTAQAWGGRGQSRGRRAAAGQWWGLAVCAFLRLRQEPWPGPRELSSHQPQGREAAAGPGLLAASCPQEGQRQVCAAPTQGLPGHLGWWWAGWPGSVAEGHTCPASQWGLWQALPSPTQCPLHLPKALPMVPPSSTPETQLQEGPLFPGAGTAGGGAWRCPGAHCCLSLPQ